MAQWSDLPTEVAEKILRSLFQSLSPTPRRDVVGKPMQRGLHPASRYLTTSKSWQRILEPLVYRNLFITDASLRGLQRLTPRQRGLVSYLSVQIDLLRHICHECSGDGPLEGVFATVLDEEEYNDELVEEALLDVFQALHQWANTRG